MLVIVKLYFPSVNKIKQANKQNPNNFSWLLAVHGDVIQKNQRFDWISPLLLYRFLTLHSPKCKMSMFCSVLGSENQVSFYTDTSIVVYDRLPAVHPGHVVLLRGGQRGAEWNESLPLVWAETHVWFVAPAASLEPAGAYLSFTLSQPHLCASTPPSLPLGFLPPWVTSCGVPCSLCTSPYKDCFRCSQGLRSRRNQSWVGLLSCLLQLP